jgi:hypothetical protein
MIKTLIKKSILYTEDKFENIMLIIMKKILREKHGSNSYIGIIGVGSTKEGYYLKGPWSTFISKEKDGPGRHARHFIKHALTPSLGPLPPDRGKPHKIVLITFPSFISRTPIFEQWKFLKDWEATIESFDLPWCELTVWR